MKPMGAFCVRDGSAKDIDGILRLRRTVFGEMEADKLDPEFWKWEFVNGPDGKAFIYLIEDGGRVVGHFADIPHRFFLNGKTLLGTISVDLMVHPDYRRRGFFTLMGQYAAERVRRAGGSFMTSFPIREKTIRGLRKLGWKTAVELPVLVYPLRFRGIIDRYVRFSPLGAILGGMARLGYDLIIRPKTEKGSGEMSLEEISEFDDLFDPFWQKILASSSIVGIRTRSFLKWRYLDHPTRAYSIYRAMRGGEMKGYVVLRTVDLLGFRSAIIVDLLALDEASVKLLLSEAIRYGGRETRDLLGFMVPRDHGYYRIAMKMGFLPSMRTFSLMLYDRGNEPDLATSRNWYVNWGDTDVI